MKPNLLVQVQQRKEGRDLFELLVRSLVPALGPSANVGGSSVLMSSEWDKGG